jgi:3-deoxy-7-phosphoheptulonate synthase
VILCERGIRTFETMTRNTFDVGAIAVMKQRTHLPVAADPSHGIGLPWAVPAMARAAIVAGADAVMVEIHDDPPHALSDGQQALTLAEFERLARELAELAEWMRGRQRNSGPAPSSP